MIELSHSATSTATTSGLPAARSRATSSYNASRPPAARAGHAAHTTAVSNRARMRSSTIAAPIRSTRGSGFANERGRLLDEVARLLGHEDVVEREARQRLGQHGDLLAVGGALVDDDAMLAFDLAQAAGPELAADVLVGDLDVLLRCDRLELRQCFGDLHTAMVSF